MEDGVMFRQKRWLPVLGAMILGVAAGWFFSARQPVWAGGSGDRHQDFILTTGPVNQAFSSNAAFLNADLDGVWLLDYRSGKLLASTINRQSGKMIAWGEMDLVKEFDIAPRSEVHFMMTTGTVVKGQSVLYLVETNTGKVGVYSMMANESATPGSSNGNILIRRHDQTNFRGNPPAQAQQQPAGNFNPQQAASPQNLPGLQQNAPAPVLPAGFPNNK
jgi:hypothetical protein